MHVLCVVAVQFSTRFVSVENVHPNQNPKIARTLSINVNSSALSSVARWQKCLPRLVTDFLLQLVVWKEQRSVSRLAGGSILIVIYTSCEI